MSRLGKRERHEKREKFWTEKVRKVKAQAEAKAEQKATGVFREAMKGILTKSSCNLSKGSCGIWATAKGRGGGPLTADNLQGLTHYAGAWTGKQFSTIKPGDSLKSLIGSQIRDQKQIDRQKFAKGVAPKMPSRFLPNFMASGHEGRNSSEPGRPVSERKVTVGKTKKGKPKTKWVEVGLP